MNDDRVLEEYRHHKLLSTFHDGKYRGRVWKEKELLFEIDGEGIADVLGKLRDKVDRHFSDTADSRSGTPEAAAYINAFRNILSELSDGHLAMLKAHYLAPKKNITATELAEAAGYTNYNAANLQYGNVGKLLYEELPVKLSKRDDGSLIYTSALATAGGSVTDEGHWVWRLRPEVSIAIAELGLHT